MQSLFRPWTRRLSPIFLRVLQRSIISAPTDEASGWEGVGLPTAHSEDLKLAVGIQSPPTFGRVTSQLDLLPLLGAGELGTGEVAYANIKVPSRQIPVHRDPCRDSAQSCSSAKCVGMHEQV